MFEKFRQNDNRGKKQNSERSVGNFVSVTMKGLYPIFARPTTTTRLTIPLVTYGCLAICIVVWDMHPAPITLCSLAFLMFRIIFPCTLISRTYVVDIVSSMANLLLLCLIFHLATIIQDLIFALFTVLLFQDQFASKCLLINSCWLVCALVATFSTQDRNLAIFSTRYRDLAIFLGAMIVQISLSFMTRQASKVNESKKVSIIPFCEEHRIIKREELTLLNEIGQGAFSSVFEGRFNGVHVAVKMLKENSDESFPVFKKEISILAGCYHPNVACLYGASPYNSNELYLVTDLNNGGNFQDLLGNPSFTFSQKLKIIQDISCGLSYLHNCVDGYTIIHHDIKPENVLIGPEHQGRISDFGVSIKIKRDGTETGLKRHLLHGGSPMWLAPEVHRNEPYNESIDIFAFALILCECLIGDGMFVMKAYNSTGLAFYELAVSQFRPRIPESIRMSQPSLVALLEDCWAEDIPKRPIAAEISSRLDDIVAFRKMQPPTPKRRDRNLSVISSSGRTYDTSDTSDSNALANICDELRAELIKQNMSHDIAIEDQKKYYEEKLSQMAYAVL